MKVFQINEYDCWAGEDFESVLKAYMDETGMDRDEALDGSAHEISEADMHKRVIFIDDEEELRDRGEDPAKVTCIEWSFYSELEWMTEHGVKFPCSFCTTLE